MPSRKTESALLAAFFLSGLSLGVVGCARNTVKADAPVAAAPAPSSADSKPITNLAPDTDALPPVETVAPPPTPVAAAAAPLPVESTHTKPPPPPHRQPAEASPDTQAEQPARTPPPQISPQLSPGDQASLRRSTGEDANVAQKNLQQANGKVLNAAQRDLQEKIRSFLAQSDEAGKSGDWSRAQTLAQKARLLSVELVDSL
jgi:type IV secretory pathway VirB10-like protein